MKRIISAVILLLFTIAIYISGAFVVNKICQSQVSSLKKSIVYIENNDIAKAKKELKKEKELKRLTHYIYKTKISEIEDSILSGYYYLCENQKKNAVICINQSIDLLNDINSEFKINIDSLF